MLSPDLFDFLQKELPPILNIKDLSLIFRCSEMTVRRMIWNKELDAFYADGEWNILREDLIKYLDKNSN